MMMKVIGNSSAISGNKHLYRRLIRKLLSAQKSFLATLSRLISQHVPE